MVASKMLDLRIWQEIAGFTFKIALWEASWNVPCRIWQEIADFTLKIALWEASWELLARIWQEIGDFTLKIALWEVLCRIWYEIADFTFKNCSLAILLGTQVGQSGAHFGSKKLPPGGD